MWHKKKIIWLNYGQLGRTKDLWSLQCLWGTGGSTESSFLTWHSHQEDLNHSGGWGGRQNLPQVRISPRRNWQNLPLVRVFRKDWLVSAKNSAYRLLFLEDDCCQRLPYPHSKETTQRLALPLGLFSCINKPAVLIQMLLIVGVSPSENTAHLTLAFLYIWLSFLNSLLTPVRFPEPRNAECSQYLCFFLLIINSCVWVFSCRYVCALSLRSVQRAHKKTTDGY